MEETELAVDNLANNIPVKGFMQYLYEGGELLGAGKVKEAKELLEKAVGLQPRSQKANNLLGLACFKLGVLDRASEIYQSLVSDNPADPTLRMNLGLVHLKLNSVDRAIQEFEFALELAPDLKKAHNYLGLAYAQAGDYERARQSFLAAGSQALAVRMERILRNSPAKTSSLSKLISAQNEGTLAKISEGGKQELSSSEIDFSTSSVDDAGLEVSSSFGGCAWNSSVANKVTKVIDDNSYMALSEFTQLAACSLPGEAFEVCPPLLCVKVIDELWTRMEGLWSISGTVQVQPEMKRFRGQSTDKSFGEGVRQMARVSGAGVLYFYAPHRSYRVLELRDESSYIVEKALFAFEKTVDFENGRVPSAIAPDLHLVHLQGYGKFVLEAADIRALAVTDQAPCTVPLSVLLGWHGDLTPKIIGLPAGTLIPAVELSGQGNVLIAHIDGENR
jgi:uncharacterized protein (AIM24 family)